MSFTYNYSFSEDFKEKLNLYHLFSIIVEDQSITKNIESINRNGDLVIIIFSELLSPSEKLNLDNIIAGYTYVHPAINFTFDKQYISSNIVTTTTASEFIDLDSMVLTTKDLGECASYTIIFNAEISLNNKNVAAEFQILIDGKSSVDRIMRYTQPSTGLTNFNNFNMCCFVKNICKNTEIKVQYRRMSENSTVYVNMRKLIIDGVRDSEINN
jgi:hypothetical protein